MGRVALKLPGLRFKRQGGVKLELTTFGKFLGRIYRPVPTDLCRDHNWFFLLLNNFFFFAINKVCYKHNILLSKMAKVIESG